MIRVLYYTLLVAVLGGCSPRVQQLAVAGVEDAMRTNNEMVAAMTALQERARFQRKAAMIQSARTVGSYEEGQEGLDAIDAKYEPVFDAFREAERVQTALAQGLELAKAAVNAGELPSMVDLMTLYMHVQAVYNSVAAALSEAP